MCTKACDLGLRAVAQPRRATAARNLNIAHKKAWREPASHPAASQAACREAVLAKLVNQKLHTDIANLRHGLMDFAKNACLKTATKTLPFFGKPPRCPGELYVVFRYMLLEKGNVLFPKNVNVFVAVFRQAFLAKSVRPCLVSLTWLPKNGNKNVAVFRQGGCQGSLR